MAREERFLVTGALGCIGSWTVATLVQSGTPVVGFDLGGDSYRLEYLLDDATLKQVDIVQGNILDLAQLDRVVVDRGITHVIHLAALQVPFCRQNPSRGAQVNVVGTVNLFEIARRHPEQVQRIVYASSAAVYGPRSAYAAVPVPVDAELLPGTLYGVYKQANEGTAQIYWQDDGISSIGLRPYIVYGVGRDQGLTSGASKAMLAAASGRTFHIPHGGRADFQLAEDVARTFIDCARVPFEGAGVHNPARNGASVAEVVAAIEAAVPEAAGTITYDRDTLLPFPDSLDDASLAALLGEVPATPLDEGVRRTIAHFKRLLHEGKIGPAAGVE